MRARPLDQTQGAARNGTRFRGFLSGDVADGFREAIG